MPAGEGADMSELQAQPAPDLGVEGPGVVGSPMCGSDIES